MNNLLVSENKFSKIFKIGEIDLYVAKAFDEESNVHFIVCSIPVIKEITAMDIQYPVYCQSEVSRDAMFDNFDIPFAEGFLDALIKEIKENNMVSFEVEKGQKGPTAVNVKPNN
jgi:hypothetical protein